MACLYDVLFRDSILFRRPAPACRPGRYLVQDGTRIDKGCDIVILDVVLNFIRSSGRTCRQARIFVSYHSLRTPREAITEIVRHAPPEVRPAIIALIRAAYRSLKRGYQPDVRAVPLRSWRSLLQLLSSVAAMQSETETLLRVSNDLLSMADHMAPPGEVLRQSAEILVHALHADLYVCRLRNPQGEWVVQAAARRDGGGIPMVVPALEEGIRNHPVMRTVKEGSARHVVSNNLRGIERGGESFDCVVYKAGYRSRLAFVLRERNDRPPFGLVLLYTQREYGFEMYDAHFLSKCARIVSLTTGRRLAVARDTLEKAAGAMAHYGNNALNIMRNQAEYCGELVEDIDNNLSRALRLSRELRAEFHEDSRGQRLALELEKILARADLTELAGHLGGVLEGTRRMTRIIGSLKKSAERPSLMRYALGQDVLKLEDDSHD
ncbi:MAG: hypothetical protein IKC62_02990 [Desulfovibrio sp.]|nr:hypothetical protein [Desulfovibrio sp.]